MPYLRVHKEEVDGEMVWEHFPYIPIPYAVTENPNDDTEGITRIDDGSWAEAALSVTNAEELTPEEAHAQVHEWYPPMVLPEV